MSKTIIFGLRLREEELVEQIRKLGKKKINDYKLISKNMVEIHELQEELDSIRESLKSYGEEPEYY